MNKDEGQHLKTTFWMPYMDMVSKEERERNQKNGQRRQRGITQPTTPNAESDVTSQDMTSDERHSMEP